MSAAATPQIDPSQLPPPPAGYTLDPQPAAQAAAPDTSKLPPPPAGYTLDQASTQGDDPFKYNLGPDFKPDFSTTVYAKAPTDESWRHELAGGWSETGPLGMLKMFRDLFNPISPQNPAAFQNAVDSVIPAQTEEWRKGNEASTASEAFGHHLAATLPMIGPVGSHIAETLAGTDPTFDQYGNVVTPGTPPNYPRAIGQMLGLLTLHFGAKYGERPGPRGGGPPDGGGPSGGGPGGPSGGGPPAISPESAAAQDVIRLGKKYNVPLTAGDITQSPALKNMEVSLEKVPGAGMQKLREGQQVDVRAAAAGIKSLYEEKLLDTDQSSLEELQSAAQAGDERARNVMGKMEEAGNDPDRIIQASIGLGDWTTRQTANELYDRVQKLAEDHNLGDVPLDATGKAIGSALQQLRPAKLPNKEVIGLLSRIRDSITPELDEEGEPVVDEQGNPVKPDNSYGLIRQLHSDLGERIREYYQGNNALIGEKGVGYLERVQNAIEDDMRNYAQNSNVPEIVDAGREADGYYKSARVPYKNGMLAAAATSNEPDQIFQQFIKAGKGDRAQNFYNALDDKGRAAVRYNMVSKAVDDAINPQSGIFSPQKFFTAVDKLDDAYGVFFNAKDKAEIQGFKNLMGHVTRAGQYAENPPTGQRVIPYLIAGAAVPAGKLAMAHPLVAGGGVAALGMMRALFTTTRGRDLLLRLNGIKPGTPVADSLWQQVGKEMPKLMQKPPEEPPEGPPTGGGSSPPETLYRAAPTAEFNKGRYPGTFFSVREEGVREGYPVHQFDSPSNLRLFEPVESLKTRRLLKEFLESHPEEEEQMGEGQDGTYPGYVRELGNLMEQPDEKWAGFLKSKGFAGFKNGSDVFLFDPAKSGVKPR